MTTTLITQLLIASLLTLVAFNGFRDFSMPVRGALTTLSAIGAWTVTASVGMAPVVAFVATFLA